MQPSQTEEVAMEKYLDAVGSIIVRLNPEGVVIFINKKGCHVIGDKKENIVGINWLKKIVPIQDELGVKKATQDLFKSKIDENLYLESWIRTRKGGSRLIAWQNGIIKGKNGNPIEVLCSGEDITDQKEAESTLKRSEERHRSLFENQLSGCAYHSIITDEKGQPVDYTFLEVNKAFERISGLKAENILGKRLSEIIPNIKKDKTDWVKIYGEVAITGKQKQFEVYSNLLKKWLSVAAYSPGFGYFVSVFEDITEKKQAEEELKKQVKQMEFIGRVNLKRHKELMKMEDEIEKLREENHLLKSQQKKPG